MKVGKGKHHHHHHHHHRHHHRHHRHHHHHSHSCAIREVEEETNLDIENVSNVIVTNDPNMDNGKHYVTIFMKGNVKEGSKLLNNNEPEKCEKWEWILW